MARSIALREALREAMVEEMRRDDRVFLMGEEVAEYNGAYKVSQGMLAEFGPKRVIDTPISELGFTAVAVGAAQKGPPRGLRSQPARLRQERARRAPTRPPA